MIVCGLNEMELVMTMMMATSLSRRGLTATEAAAPMRARPARGAIRAANGLR